MVGHGVKFYNSIGFRLSALMAAVIFASILALSYLNASQSLERETENYTALMTGAATAYAAAVADAVHAEDRASALSTLRGIRDLPNVVQVDITLSNGPVFAELGTGSFLVARPGSEISLWRADTVRVDTPIMQSGAEIGRLGMLVDLKPLRAEILQTLYSAVLSSSIVIIIGVIIAQFFLSQLMAPIRRLTKIMASIRDGTSEPTPDLRDRKDETGVMTQTFLDMMGSIQDRDEQISRHLETLEDTVEERTHDLRLAKEDAEAANAAKSDFLATMSHEIRTPMNGMMVMAEMLGAADLTPRHRRYAEIIHRSGSSLLTIINDILDLSKIEAGHLDLECIPVSPENLVADIASLFWERARGKSLELATYVSPRVPSEIVADPTRLNQIISNLVNNALKFTDAGGVLVRIDARHTAKDHCLLAFEIIDTGIGIPEDKIDHIFESFSQADQSTTRRFGGTGLGLSVCQRLVAAMDGTIAVRSKLGHGSTFRVELPAAVSVAAPHIPPADLRVGTDLREGLVKMSIEQSLRSFGCAVTDEAPDLWITSTEYCQPRDAPCVLLTDIGDTQADALLLNGCAADSLHNPYCRSELAALLARAQTGTFRGSGAIQGNGTVKDLKNFEGLRILAADDNAVNREVLREALATLKAEAIFVEDGAQAVEMFATSKFDLIFMDGSMPVMDGFKATREIRALESNSRAVQTPIYALTAQVAGVSKDAWQNAGADGHILKPFTLEKLTDILSGLGAKVLVDSTIDHSRDPRALLDMDTIATLEKLGNDGTEVREKVWSMFNDKATGMLSELHACMDAGSTEDVAKQAHAFKSMALSSGLGGFAAELQRLESLAKDGDQTSVNQVSKDAITDVLLNTKAEMRRYSHQAA